MGIELTEEEKKQYILAHLSGIADTAYGMYQLEWMKQHGYTLQDLMEQIDVQEHGGSEATYMLTVFEDEGGFNGECWVCKEEFMQNEFQDKEYMKQLLDTDLFIKYAGDMDYLKAKIAEDIAKEGENKEE